MHNPTFPTAHIRNAEKYTLIPVNTHLTCADVTLPMGLQVTIMSEDGLHAVIRFAHKSKLYQTVVPQDNLMIDFRTVFKY
jgi:hypothetical protein